MSLSEKKNTNKARNSRKNKSTSARKNNVDNLASQQVVALEEAIQVTKNIKDNKSVKVKESKAKTDNLVKAKKNTKVKKELSSAKMASLSSDERFLLQNGTGKREVYPLISLRSIIITPAANVQLIAARENTVLALEEALKSKSKEIVVFSQNVDMDVVAQKQDLARVGVVAKILSGSYNNKSQFKATIRGFARVSICNIIDDNVNPVRYAEVEYLKEQEIDKSIAQRYLSAVHSALDSAILEQQANKRKIFDKGLPSEVLNAIREVDDLVLLVDGLSQILLLPYFDKKYILESLNPIDRAKAIIAFLNDYSYKAEVDKKIAEDARAAMERNQRDFYLNEQLKAIKRELNIQYDDASDIEEYRARVKTLDAPDEVINRLNKDISRLAVTPSNSGETSTIRNYIETLLSIPWTKSTKLNRNLVHAKEVLEQEHYGLSKVKDRILEFLAVQTRRENVDAHGQILCLIGPPGIGKTSLANSIAKATGRKYVRMALGGMYDESEIRGHRRTYVGAMPGRIIQSMIKCGVNNPLFLLDEIDKVSTSNYRGDISAALLEVLDPEQNKSFGDNYVDLDYDLSHVLFIATANSYNIPPALRDRMEIIDLSSYTADEKFHIAREHLLPKQLSKNGLSKEEFDISDEGLQQLIQHYTLEAGVRSLERIIAELCRKVVKNVVMQESEKENAKLKAKGKEDFEATEDKISVVIDSDEELKSTKANKRKIKKTVLTIKDIEKMIGPKRYDFTSKLKDNRVGIVNGLSVSSVGGDMLQVEVIANEGKGSHLLTGQLGSVMKESVSAAISWVRSHARAFSLAPDFYQSVDLHVHFPEGAIKKDGPSAGCTTVTAILSALTGNAVRSDVAMTGEITLRGDVLAIGGLKEKLLAALRGGVKTVCIPYENKKDLWDIPKNITEGLKIVPVKTIDEVLKIALEKDPRKFKPITLTRWSLKDYEERQAKIEQSENSKLSIKSSLDADNIQDINNDEEVKEEKPNRGRRRNK